MDKLWFQYWKLLGNYRRNNNGFKHLNNLLMLPDPDKFWV
jgi:hypothetical protein